MLKELLASMEERIIKLEKDIEENPLLISRIKALEKEVTELKKQKRFKA